MKRTCIMVILVALSLSPGCIGAVVTSPPKEQTFLGSNYQGPKTANPKTVRINVQIGVSVSDFGNAKQMSARQERALKNMMSNFIKVLSEEDLETRGHRIAGDGSPDHDLLLNVLVMEAAPHNVFQFSFDSPGGPEVLTIRESGSDALSRIMQRLFSAPTLVAALEAKNLPRREKRPSPRPAYAATETQQPASINNPIAQRWAVVIGIDGYKDARIPSLQTAEADAVKIKEVIASRIGLDADHIKILTGSQATQQNIRSAMGTWLARKATKDDLVLIYYAGHGAPETDYSRKSPDGLSKYLVPYDAKADDLFATAIPMTEIATIFDRIEARSIIFFSDACYSGAAGGRSFMMGKFRSVLIGDPTAVIAKGKGRIIITAGQANEPAVEDAKLGHGVFTYYLLEGLSGKAANASGSVTLSGLYSYLSDRVTRKSKELGGNQHPVMKGELQGDIVLIAPKATPAATSK